MARCGPVSVAAVASVVVVVVWTFDSPFKPGQLDGYCTVFAADFAASLCAALRRPGSLIESTGRRVYGHHLCRTVPVVPLGLPPGFLSGPRCGNVPPAPIATAGELIVRDPEPSTFVLADLALGLLRAYGQNLVANRKTLCFTALAAVLSGGSYSFRAIPALRRLRAIFAVVSVQRRLTSIRLLHIAPGRFQPDAAPFRRSLVLLPNTRHQSPRWHCVVRLGLV